MKIIMKELSETEGLPPNVRWDETCECVQTLWGDTWVDNPGADPRHNPGGLAPINDTSDPQCSAAFGMRTRVEQILNLFYVADALIDAANAIFALITLFNPPASLLWRIVITVVEALYAIGSAAITIAFDEAAFDQLQCIFYANIDNEGQMSAAQLSDINTQICDDMDVTVCAVMGLILNMVGEVGMSNFGALLGEDSDCSDCGWCFNFIAATGLGAEWSVDTYGSWSGTEWVGTVIGGGSYGTAYGVSLFVSIPPTKITEVLVQFSVSYNDGNRPTIVLVRSGVNVARYDSPYGQGTYNSNTLVGASFAEVEADKIVVFTSGLPAVIVDRIQVSGVGSTPFDPSNC